MRMLLSSLENLQDFCDKKADLDVGQEHFYEKKGFDIR